MRDNLRASLRRNSGCFLASVSLFIACSFYVGQVSSLPADTSNQWPVFQRRNLASLAREGYLKGVGGSDKRSISTLAKNGQLPTFRSPYGEAVKDDPDDEGSHEKRDLAALAELPSFSGYKRNIQALARDGHRFGRNQQTDKRNIQSMARNGYIHKRNVLGGDEYYYPFYQNSVPPLAEMDGPLDFNELYDFQQSINPEMLPPLSQVFKRSDVDYFPEFNSNIDYDSKWNLKRGAAGLPAHGLYRPVYIDLNSSDRNKRSIYSIPDVLDRNDVDLPDDYDTENDDKRSVDFDEAFRENFEKRHIGSLARLGLLPSFRFSGGRYSRSGRARLLLPNQELYRKHSPNENFGFRQYIPDTEADAPVFDDSDIPPPAVSAHTHPTGRLLHRLSDNHIPHYPHKLDYDRWQPNNPKFYYFRSLKVPYHASGKRYLIQPDMMMRKPHTNASLPSRRKNQ